MSLAHPRVPGSKIPFDNVDYPPIPQELLAQLSSSMDGKAQSPWGFDLADARRELGRTFGFLLESEISLFKSTWQVAQWLALNLKPERSASVLFSCFEPEGFVVPFVNSLRMRGFAPQVVPIDDDYNARLDLLTQPRKQGPTLFLLSMVGPITGRISRTAEVIKFVHERGGLVAADATHYVQRVSPALGAIDSDLTLVRSRPLLVPEGLVVVYLSRRIRETLKRDADASGSWQTMSSLDSPVELVALLANSVKFLSGMTNRRRNEMEYVKMVLEGLRDCSGVRLIGPASTPERVAIFTIEVSGLSSPEVALMLDSSADLLVSSGKPGIGSSQLCRAYPESGAIRASPFIGNCSNEVQMFIEAMRLISSSLR